MEKDFTPQLSIIQINRDFNVSRVYLKYVSVRFLL